MRADPYPLRQVLAQERRYVVPTFQRNYEWTQDGQWELLADDLEAVAERLGQERHHAEVTGGNIAKADERVSPHFLGAVVLDRLPPDRAGGIDLRSVIDGQQRLTTLQLLVRALLDVAIEEDSSRQRSLVRLLRNPDDVADLPHEVHKLWPRRKDRVTWADAMADSPSGEHAAHRYFQARTYFASRLRSAISEGVVNLDLLVDACLEMFRIVVIDLDDNDDAQVIFEVLNGRQTPLSSADLVKNLLFLRAEQQQVPDVEDLYERHWEQFDADWWQIRVGRGHAARQHANIMLSAWLTIASGEPAHPDRLYGQVRRHLDFTGAKIPDVLAEISAYAQHYRAYQAALPESDERIAEAYERMRTLGSNTALPVVLWLREQATSGRLQAVDHRDAVVDLESYLVRRVAVGANTRSYGLTFRDLLTESMGVTGNSTDIATHVRATLAGLTGSAAWPTDAEVAEAFATRKYYDNVAGYVIKMLLAGVEEHLRTGTAQTERLNVEYDDLTIEHILPQAWGTHWPLDGEGAALVLAGQNRDAHVHRIGNLTLINGSLNSSQSHKPWAEKRAELAKFSSLRLNNDLVLNESWDTWDEDAITRRAVELANIACKVWPR